MTSLFFNELLKVMDMEKTAVDIRRIQNLSRAQSPGIKLLSGQNTGKPFKPVFNTNTMPPKGPLANTFKNPTTTQPNFPYMKPTYKGGLRDASVATPSATPNMQV